MTIPRRILVLGATGKQGGALISALLSRPSQPFQIDAVTRNARSNTAQALAKNPGIKIVEGDFADPTGLINRVQKPLWGIFIVTNPIKGAKIEEQQGKAVVNAAIDAGVKHVVFTSTDRGGQEKSEHKPTPIPHFASKYYIEQLIFERAKEQREKNGHTQDENSNEKNHKNHKDEEPLTYTILRPVAFFSNLTPSFLGSAFTSMWRLNGPNHPLQLISTTDIGLIAADAFLNSEAPEYRNTAISLAGDEITPADAERIFKEETELEIPATYSFVGRALRLLLREQLGVMFDWFRDEGFGVDVKGLRARYPFLRDFRTWVREESEWRKNEDGDELHSK